MEGFLSLSFFMRFIMSPFLSVSAHLSILSRDLFLMCPEWGADGVHDSPTVSCSILIHPTTTVTIYTFHIHNNIRIHWGFFYLPFSPFSAFLSPSGTCDPIPLPMPRRVMHPGFKDLGLKLR